MNVVERITTAIERSAMDEDAAIALLAVRFGERFKVCRPRFSGDPWSIIERNRMHGGRRQSVIIGYGATLAEVLAVAERAS